LWLRSRESSAALPSRREEPVGLVPVRPQAQVAVAHQGVGVTHLGGRQRRPGGQAATASFSLRSRLQVA
jgi:hypothetical protein